MLRLTEIRLPLDHPPEALQAAAQARLGGADVAGLTVFRRGYDARNPKRIMLAYTLDVSVADEAALLARKPALRLAPDTSYRFVAQAPEGLAERPVVIGTGPCGLFAALILAQSGFRPIDRKSVV